VNSPFFPYYNHYNNISFTIAPQTLLLQLFYAALSLFDPSPDGAPAMFYVTTYCISTFIFKVPARLNIF